MAEVKVIEVQIKSNLDGATTSVSKFKAGLKEATTQSKELGGTLQGNKQSEFIDKLGDGVGKLNPAFGSAVKGANGLILKMYEMVANPVGLVIAALVVSVKFLYEAFQSSVAGGKELKAVFSAVSAVGEQVKDAIFGLGRAFINLTSAAIKFITLDFKGASEDIKKANKESSESYKQLGNAVDGTTAKIAYNLTKQQQANDKARKVQAVVQSETNKLLVQSREILTDETASLKDKKKALEEVTKAEKASSAEKVRIAAEDLRILKARAASLGGEAEKKMKGEIREATIALNESETENAMTGIKLNKQRKMLGRQEVADAKEKNDAIIAANKEAADKKNAQLKIEQDERKRIAKENLDSDMASAKEAVAILDTLNKSLETPAQKEQREYEEKKAILQANNLDISLLTQQHEANLALITKTEKEKAAADKKAIDDKIIADAKIIADEEIRIAKAVADQKKALQDAQLNAISAGIGLLSGLAGKNKTLQKAAIIAESAMGIARSIIANTASNVAVAAQGAALAIPTAGASVIAAGSIITTNNIATGIGIAANIAATAKALSSVGGGGAPSGGGQNMGGGGSGASSAAPNFNVVGASSTNQLAQTIGNKEAQPIKAYVVANDVTTQQSLDRNIVKSATIG